MPEWVTIWQCAADDILSVLLTQPGGWKVALFDHGLRSADFPPGNWQTVYKVVCEIRSAQNGDANAVPILHDTEIAARCPGVSVEWVATRLALCDPSREMAMTTNCKLLSTYGRLNQQLVALKHAQGALLAAMDKRQVDNTGGIIETLLDDLRTEQPAQGKSGDITTLLTEIEGDMNRKATPGLQLGIPSLDRWQRGAEPGENIYINAARKSRKTSVLANIALAMARNEVNLTLISLDETPKRFAYRLWVMLMAEWFWKNKLWDTVEEVNGVPIRLNVIDRKMLVRSGQDWQTWFKPQKEAYHYAVEEGKKLKQFIRIYGPHEGGKSLAGLKTLVLSDRAKYGVQAFALDHIQALDDLGADIFKKVEFCSYQLHLFAVELNIPAIILSQKNIDSIRTGKADDGITGAKGGGGIDSNADAIYEPYYKVDIADDRYLQFIAKLCRDTQTPAYEVVQIHPQSGWITPRILTPQEVKVLKSQ